MRHVVLFVTLLLPREVRAFASSGGSCRCTRSNAGLPADAGVGAEYATYCAAWDEKTEVCVDAWGGDPPGWCSSEWCYVEEDCPSASPSAYFPGSGLFYAYSACAGDDTFSQLCNHRERGVKSGALAGLIAITGDLPSPDICEPGIMRRRLHGTTPERSAGGVGLALNDLNGDGVVTEEDRKLYFEKADADGNGCLTLCEYMDFHEHQQKCPLTRFWKLNFASWFVAETDPLLDRKPGEQIWKGWKEGFCYTKEEFMKGFENRYWRCHRTREQYFNPNHFEFPPHCFDPVPAKNSI